jgi:2-aminophenol/2-amino-5-chlorophenol 1,6-dioxygenase alpha subunit
MTVVSAFLIPGSPLPFVQGDNPPWGKLADAMKTAGKALAKSRPDTILLYSTQWLAVLDQLWQTRPHLQGVHVDENWHEYGDLPFDIRSDTELAEACVVATNTAGIKSKGVDYAHFPIDTGTIVAANFLNPDNDYPYVITSNNLYHDWDMTEKLGQIALEQASRLDKKVAVIVVGGLSGSFFRQTISIAKDHIANQSEDDWNRKILDLIERGEVETLRQLCPDYAAQAKVDMGFKHLAFLLGALNGSFSTATCHAYGPLYGTGAAVIEFQL